MQRTGRCWPTTFWNSGMGASAALSRYSSQDDLVTTLENLLERRSQFDYIIIETTGLANPGPVASVFWLDEALESALRLDGIITVVDAKHIGRHLDRTPSGPSQEEAGTKGPSNFNEATMQIAFADRIIINKTDLVSPDELESLRARILSMNAVAQIVTSQRCAVRLDWLLDIQSFDPEAAITLDPSLSAPPNVHGHQGGQDSCQAHTSGGSCTDAAHHHACGVHDSDVSTVMVEDPSPVNIPRLERWIGSMLWDGSETGQQVYRIKGLLHAADEPNRLVLQGVHDLFDISTSSAWDSPDRNSKIVFIGRHLDSAALREQFITCLDNSS